MYNCTKQLKTHCCALNVRKRAIVCYKCTLLKQFHCTYILNVSIFPSTFNLCLSSAILMFTV